MKGVIKSLLFLLLGTLPSGEVKAQECDDYISRHYRQDIAPESISISKASLFGAPLQKVTVGVRNWGEVDLNGCEDTACTAGFYRIYISINGREASTYLPYVIPSGGAAALSLYYPDGTFSQCGSYTVSIDTRRSAGQWGCGVYWNDTKSLSIPLFKCLQIVTPRLPLGTFELQQN